MRKARLKLYEVTVWDCHETQKIEVVVVAKCWRAAVDKAYNFYGCEHMKGLRPVGEFK